MNISNEGERIVWRQRRRSVTIAMQDEWIKADIGKYIMDAVTEFVRRKH